MAEGNKVEVYVKASAKDGKGIGDCPLCQRIMIILRLKGIPGEYIPVNMTLIPPAFKTFCNDNGVPIKVPVLRHGEYVVYNPNDIAYYIDKEWPEPSIKSENEVANKVAANLYSKFMGYMKNRNKALDEKYQNAMLDEFKKLNNFLDSVNSPGKFLDGDELKHPDCDILPKVYQARIALRKYKNFEIPDYLPGLKAYLDAAEEDPAFKSSCPPDDAIIEAWRKHLM